MKAMSVKPEYFELSEDELETFSIDTLCIITKGNRIAIPIDLETFTKLILYAIAHKNQYIADQTVALFFTAYNDIKDVSKLLNCINVNV